MYIYVEREKERLRRNPKRGREGRGGGGEDIEFPGVLKKYHVKILGVN